MRSFQLVHRKLCRATIATTIALGVSTLSATPAHAALNGYSPTFLQNRPPCPTKHCLVTMSRDELIQLGESKRAAADSTDSVPSSDSQMLIPASHVKFPGACRDIIGYYYSNHPNRFTSCYIRNNQIMSAVTWYEDGTFSIDGTIEYAVVQAFVGNATAATWRHNAAITLAQVGYGVLSGGAFVQQLNACAFDCTSKPGTNTSLIHISPDNWAESSWQEAATPLNPNQVRAYNDTLGVHVYFPPANYSGAEYGASTDSIVGNIDFRCDNAVGSSAGCVNPAYPNLTLELNAQQNPNYGPIAQHAYDHQTTQYFKWGRPASRDTLTSDYSGNWVHRLADPALILDNRRVTCPTSPGGGMQCDEFPFASTHEGAATCTWCGYTTMNVPDISNRAQGGALSTFIQQNRVLDGDAYYVRPTLIDGRSSW
jgi:hypothetical protein